MKFQIGQRVRFTDGQRGSVSAIYNNGDFYLFASDTGTTFTVAGDEIAAEEPE